MDRTNIDKTISFLKKRLNVNYYHENFNNLHSDTDLTKLDIYSIIFMTLLLVVEEEFLFKISLDKLKKNQYKTTPLIFNL